MKVAVYFETSLLERIATEGESLKWISPYALHLVFDDAERPQGKWFAGEFELKVPSRDAAVMWAEKAIRAEAAQAQEIFKGRLARLLALTWEAPK